MDEFEWLYGNFRVWRSRFLPGWSGEDCKMIDVPMERVVNRFVVEKHQKYKEKLLDRWKREIQADGVTMVTDIALDESAWNG